VTAGQDAAPAGRARDPALGRPGAPPGGYYGPPAESRLIRAAQMPPGKRGPGRKEPRWSAERRAGQRHWPVDLRPNSLEIGPTARRATGAAFRAQRLSALCPPPATAGGQKGTTAYPAPQRIRAAKLGLFSPFFFVPPACHGDSLAADDPPRATADAITANGHALHRRAGARFIGASVSRAIAPAIHNTRRTACVSDPRSPPPHWRWRWR